MKLIIDIDNDVYDDIEHNKGEYINTLNWAVRNGVPYEEKPRGEWVVHAEYYSNADIECSVCHNWLIGFNKGLETDFYRYCPFCGTDMVGDKNETDN